MKVFTKQIAIMTLMLGCLVSCTSALAEGFSETFFVPMTGCRLFDTRASVVGGQIRPRCLKGNFECIALRSYFIFDGGTKIRDQGGANDCIVPRQAVAVHMALNVFDVAGKGYLRSWPFDGNSEGRPKATLSGWKDGGEMTVVPLLINPLSGSFNVTFRFYLESKSAFAHFVGDVLGYYVPVNDKKSF